jgi:hypothetical protein
LETAFFHVSEYAKCVGKRKKVGQNFDQNNCTPVTKQRQDSD